ncbi:MAG: c-type cytochrome [Dehalococcoidales bacterium]|nr:c-type cytochrome [Dehalococcoidales bacterium]
MIKKLLFLSFIIAGALITALACGGPETPPQTETPPVQTEMEPAPATLAHAGRLYDKWWGEIGQDVPSGDNPVWARQTTNTRSGAGTWRCKECHGWDYKGVSGVYSSGSHKTGFTGLLQASGKSREDLAKQLKGEIDSQHDFSAMTDLHVGHLVDFLKYGMIDDSKYIDYSTKKTIGADVAHGEELYTSTCVPCHGADGKTIDIEGAGIGAIANGNPWETLHKIRFGQPGTAMPAAVASGWSTEEAVDVLGYAQTLPE